MTTAEINHSMSTVGFAFFSVQVSASNLYGSQVRLSDLNERDCAGGLVRQGDCVHVAPVRVYADGRVKVYNDIARMFLRCDDAEVLDAVRRAVAD